MGCGVSQSVLSGNDDVSKSDAFIRLCANEKNPIASQLNSYFNALMAECMYKSQGDMDGYQRLLAKRPTEITVNRSRLAAQRHGIGHKPLTVGGVNDIMNLFLGHAIKSLEKRKWSGTFNYTLMQPLQQVVKPGSNDSGAVPSTSTTRVGSAPSENGSPAATTQLKKSKAEAAATPNDSKVALAPSAGGSPLSKASAENAPGTTRTARSAFTVPASVAGNSSTIVFVDSGTGSRKDDDLSRQWRMELTGNITFVSVDGAQTLICDCKVDFLFFTCDTQLPLVAAPLAAGSQLNNSSAKPSQRTSPPRSRTEEYFITESPSMVEHRPPASAPLAAPVTPKKQTATQPVLMAAT